jgi:hypothetical protein
MRDVTGVLLPLVTLELLHGMLKRWEKGFHALGHGIRVAWHVDDLKRELQLVCQSLRVWNY